MVNYYNGGCTDKIQVLKEIAWKDGGLAGEKVFGVTRKFEWKIETNVQQSYALETAGPQAAFNTDGVLLISGTHEFEFVDGKCFEAILGTLTDSGTGSFTLAVANILPTYSVKVIDDYGAGKYLIIKGLKYSKFTVSLTREETIKITADWQAYSIADTTTFTPTAAGVEPLVYLDGKTKFGNTYVPGLDSIDIELDRKVVARRFCENITTGERRLITALIEGSLTISYSGSQTAARAVVEKIFGSTTIQDVRTDVNMSFEIARSTQTLTLAITGSRHATIGRTLDKNEEVAMMDFSGFGLQITGSGSYKYP